MLFFYRDIENFGVRRIIILRTSDYILTYVGLFFSVRRFIFIRTHVYISAYARLYFSVRRILFLPDMKFFPPGKAFFSENMA